CLRTTSRAEVASLISVALNSSLSIFSETWPFVVLRTVQRSRIESTLLEVRPRSVTRRLSREIKTVSSGRFAAVSKRPSRISCSFHSFTSLMFVFSFQFRERLRSCDRIKQIIALEGERRFFNNFFPRRPISQLDSIDHAVLQLN